MKKNRLAAFAAVAAFPMLLLSQNITGTVTAADTGAPLPGAAVVAVQRTTSPSQAPGVYRTRSGAAGQYALPLPSGQYQVCVHETGLYLDPCRWDRTGPVTVGTGTTVLSLRLQKGAHFVLRLKDPKRVLPSAEKALGSATAVFVAIPAGQRFPLPLLHDFGNMRDYGEVVPLNLPMNIAIGNAHLALSDAAGAGVGPQGIPFQVTAADIPMSPAATNAALGHFRPGTSKVIRAYVAGPR